MRLNLLVFLFFTFSLTACNTLNTQSPEPKTANNTNTKIQKQTKAAKSPLPALPLTVVKLAPPIQQAPLEAASPSITSKPQIKIIKEQPLVKNDIWTRLQDGMALPYADNQRIRSQRDWYVKHKDYLNRVITRAKPFLHYILNEIEARGLPSELALLPIVESAFQTYAYSHGRASGLWQIIPPTATYLKLEQNWWYDGRRDIYLSTKAALNYLDILSKQFEGDAVLALASYNAGPGTVRKAIRHNKKLSRPTDYWHLTKLRKETLDYVPKLYALKQIFENPERYGVNLLDIDDTPGFEVADINQQIDVATAAKLAELSLDEFYQYNPAFNQWATPPKGRYHFLFPLGKKAIFEKNYAQLPASERIKWVRHKIKTGETLSRIAQKYSSRVALINQVNRIKKNRIHAGKYLMVPTATHSLKTYSQSNSSRLAKTQSKTRGEIKSTHTVKNGDSLWTIAQRYQVSHRSLAKWNAMAPTDTLKTGKKLVIWKNKPTSFKKPILVSFSAPKAQIRSIRYTVRKGDSVARIARKFNVNMNDIKKWNRIGKYIQPGQKIKLWVDVTSQSI